jgi:hypothetical protein
VAAEAAYLKAAAQTEACARHDWLLAKARDLRES